MLARPTSPSCTSSRSSAPRARQATPKGCRCRPGGRTMPAWSEPPRHHPRARQPGSRLPPGEPCPAASTVAASIAVAAVTGTCALAPARAATAPARAASSFLHPPRSIAAYAAELADGTTGKQLWGRRQYSPRPIASITKVMTALVVVQARRLGRRIKITAADVAYARENGATSAGLRPGDVLTARQLLYATLLPSAADAAFPLAATSRPGRQAFVRKMNTTARRLHLV